jgi:hypothetical protein
VNTFICASLEDAADASGGLCHAHREQVRIGWTHGGHHVFDVSPRLGSAARSQVGKNALADAREVSAQGTAQGFSGRQGLAVCGVGDEAFAGHFG